MNFPEPIITFSNQYPVIFLALLLLIFNWISYGILKLIIFLLKKIKKLFKKRDIQGDKISKSKNTIGSLKSEDQPEPSQPKEKGGVVTSSPPVSAKEFNYDKWMAKQNEKHNNN